MQDRVNETEITMIVPKFGTRKGTAHWIRKKLKR